MKEPGGLSSQALHDFFEMWDYIRQDNPAAADRAEAELLETCESLARMPGQGHRRPDYTKAPILFFPVYSYFIALPAWHCPAADSGNCGMLGGFEEARALVSGLTDDTAHGINQALFALECSLLFPDPSFYSKAATKKGGDWEYTFCTGKANWKSRSRGDLP